jgi:hypothetical protein
LQLASCACVHQTADYLFAYSVIHRSEAKSSCRRGESTNRAKKSGSIDGCMQGEVSGCASPATVVPRSAIIYVIIDHAITAGAKEWGATDSGKELMSGSER